MACLCIPATRWQEVVCWINSCFQCNHVSLDWRTWSIRTYKFFTVLLLSVTADVTLSATCTPVSGCRATMEDDTNADSALFFKRGILETSLAKSIVLTSYSWFLAIVGHLSPSTCMSLDQVQGEVKLEWELTQEFGNCLIILWVKWSILRVI